MKRVVPRDVHGKWYYHVPDLDRMFERIIGGMGFPYGDKPGFAVFLGVERYDPILRVAPAFWIDEVEEHDISRFFERCCNRVYSYTVKGLWANTRNEDHESLLMDWNRHRDDQRLKRLNVEDAYSSKPGGSISYHLTAVRERLKPERKSIFLSNESILESALMDIRPIDTPKATDTEFPAVAALAYAIVGLNTTTPDPEEAYGQQRDDYDPLTYL